MDVLLKIINALMPLLVGVLGVGATLFGSNLNNRWQNRRDINNIRSQHISKLFSYINESERNIMKIKLSIQDDKGVDNAIKIAMLSVNSLQKEYDKCAVYLPDSVAQIVEHILNDLTTVNTHTIMNERDAALKEIDIVEDSMKQNKKELREVFQYMIGVKK